MNIGADLEAGCIVNTGASVVRLRLGVCVHIAPGAHVGGHVGVGDEAGSESVPAFETASASDRMSWWARAAVISDLADGCTAVGVQPRSRD